MSLKKLTKQCLECGKEYGVIPSKYKTRKYCSRKCFAKAMKGHTHGMTGKKHSPETKRKISNSLKGNVPWNKGKDVGPLDREHRDKLAKYKIDLDFFKSWGSGVAWTLGIIVADGCIHKKDDGGYGLVIKLKDKDVLEKIKTEMESNSPIRKYSRPDGREIWSLIIWRKEICKDLISLGVTPNKSLTVKFPPVPRKYLSHFLRGVLDGDGSIYKGSVITTAFYTASWDFAEGIAEKITMAGFSPHIYDAKTKSKHVLYRVLCWDNGFLPWIYKDKKDLYLKRKYQKWQSLSSISGL